jgi:hypothetical protein
MDNVLLQQRHDICSLHLLLCFARTKLSRHSKCAKGVHATVTSFIIGEGTTGYPTVILDCRSQRVVIRRLEEDSRHFLEGQRLPLCLDQSDERSHGGHDMEVPL